MGWIRPDIENIEEAISRWPHNSWAPVEVLELVAYIKLLEDQRLLLRQAASVALGYFGEQGAHPSMNHPDSHHYERLADALNKTLNESSEGQ